MWPFYRYCDRLKQTDYTLARWEWALPHLNVNCIPSSGRILKQGWSRFLDIKLGRGALRWVSLDRRDSTDTAVFLRFGIFCILTQVSFPWHSTSLAVQYILVWFCLNTPQINTGWGDSSNFTKVKRSCQSESSKSMLTSRQKVTLPFWWFWIDPIVISFIFTGLVMKKMIFTELTCLWWRWRLKMGSIMDEFNWRDYSSRWRWQCQCQWQWRW